jgi:hypothetical protein
MENARTRALSGGRIITWAAGIIFVGGSALFLLGVSAAILQDRNFPLNFGLIRTIGRAGLWITLLPALAGLAGLALLRRSRSIGASLVGLYSLFWAVVAASGLPGIWNASRSFCLQGLNLCITSPWLGRLLLIAIAASFLGVAAWSWRQIGSSASTRARPTT